MDVTMSQNSKKEYLKKMRWRYAQRSGKRGKSVLIDEFCEVTGYERKYAIKLLGCRRRRPGAKPRKVGRKPTYGRQVAVKLKEIWLLAEQPCGKRLAPILPLWLRSYEKQRGSLSRTLREKLLRISPAQIDRLLEPCRAEFPGRTVLPPKSNAALKALTPIRAEAWDVQEPGWLECDTVAHCGGSMRGNFLWSLSAVDVFSGWTEIGSVWNCGQHAVRDRFEQIEARLPFALRGVDTDNGGEFLNWHFRDSFKDREPAVKLTRSRPYRKNDQAHVEQKNYTHVRQLLGYDRLGHEELVQPINDLVRLWSLWRNLYCATMKQTESYREGGRLIRRHEKRPQTPCRRLIDHWRAHNDAARARRLEAQEKEHDPITMKEDIEKKLKKINRQREQLDRRASVPGASTLRSKAPGTESEQTTPRTPKTKKASVSSIMSQRAAA